MIGDIALGEGESALGIDGVRLNKSEDKQDTQTCTEHIFTYYCAMITFTYIEGSILINIPNIHVEKTYCCPDLTCICIVGPIRYTHIYR